MKNTISRSFKIWFFTNLVGSLFFLLVFPEKGNMDFLMFLMVCALGGIFSSPSLFISAFAINKLKSLPENAGLRFCFMAGITLSIIVLVVLFFDRLFIGMRFRMSDLVRYFAILYPYIITALVMTIYFTRDLIFVHPEEPVTPSQETTEI